MILIPIAGVNWTEFESAATAGGSAPPGLSPALLALWHDLRGDWDAAHQAAQSDPGGEGAWVHAYLHRKEGDESNASYWYRRAERPIAESPLNEERAAIGRALLAAR